MRSRDSGKSAIALSNLNPCQAGLVCIAPDLNLWASGDAPDMIFLYAPIPTSVGNNNLGEWNSQLQKQNPPARVRET